MFINDTDDSSNNNHNAQCRHPSLSLSLRQTAHPSGNLPHGTFSSPPFYLWSLRISSHGGGGAAASQV